MAKLTPSAHRSERIVAPLTRQEETEAAPALAIASRRRSTFRQPTPLETLLLTTIADRSKDGRDISAKARVLLAVANGATYGVAVRDQGWRSGQVASRLIAAWNMRGIAALRDTRDRRRSESTQDEAVLFPGVYGEIVVEVSRVRGARALAVVDQIRLNDSVLLEASLPPFSHFVSDAISTVAREIRLARAIQLDQALEEIVVSTTTMHHVIHLFPSDPRRFVYAVFDRQESNLAMARRIVQRAVHVVANRSASIDTAT